MDVDAVEGHIAHGVEPEHNHPGDPVGNDVARGDEHATWIKLLEVFRRLRPTKRTERPQGRAEPCVENVFVLNQLGFSQPSLEL